MKKNERKLFKGVICILMCFCFFTAAAQKPKVNVQWETEFNKAIQGKVVYDSYLGEDDNSFYFLTRKLVKSAAGVKFGVVKYNKKTLKPQAEKIFENLGIVKDVYTVDAETYAIVYENPPVYFKVTKKAEYGLYKFNRAKMEFEPMASKLSNIKLNNNSFFTSPDNSKILLATHENGDKKVNENESYTFHVYDNQFNKLWSKSITTPYQITKFTDHVKTSYIVDNDGNVYMAGKAYKEDLKKSSRERYIDFEYKIIKVTAGSDKQEFNVDMNGLFYNRCHIQTDKNNNLFVIGFYSDKSNLQKTGSYFFVMNNDFSKAENISYQEIPLKYLTSRRTGAETKELEKDVNTRYKDFRFDKALFDEKGSIVLCAEENDKKITTSSSSTGPGASTGMSTMTGGGMSAGVSAGISTTSTKTTTYSYDIYVFKITPEKSLAWSKRIPKYQISSDGNKVGYAPMLSDRLGYTTLLSGDDVVVLFLDIPKNMSAKENTEKVERVYGKGIQLVSVVFNKDGVQSKQMAYDPKALKLDPEMRNVTHLSNNKVIITARKSKKSKIGILNVAQ